MDGETGRPTGVLRENAVKLLQRLMSEEGGREAKREQLRTCLGKLGSVGLVGVQGGNSMLYCVLTVGCQYPFTYRQAFSGVFCQQFISCSAGSAQNIDAETAHFVQHFWP